MEAFLSDLALLFIGAVLGPGIWRLIRAPVKAKSVYRQVQRRLIDNEARDEWAQNALEHEMDLVGAQMNARKLHREPVDKDDFKDAMNQVVKKHLWITENEGRSCMRDMEDAFDTLNFLERFLYMRLEKNPPRTPEAELVEQQKQRMKEDYFTEDDDESSSE